MSRGRGGKRGRGGGGRGGGGRGGGRGRGRGGGGGGGNNYADTRQSFDQVPKHNEKLERYYNTLNIVPEGPEREAFWTALKRELPNAFRFCGSKGHALSVRKNLTERFFPLIKDIKHNGEPVELPQAMPWYPEGLAYSMTTPKNVVRKYEPFKEFQKFLVSETGVGNISRQEQVSMIPPLLLDVQPHHAVLDLCAAPGSKSAQLIELIHVGEEDRVGKALSALKERGSAIKSEELGLEDYGRTTGLLVANDVNYQRAQMLVHQVKRLNSPNLVVTNHDATMFPSIELPPTRPSQARYLKFDRILADVPCSGDGTARKNPNVWKDWTPVNAMGLYITQVRILVRAIQMLKAGGRVVYSTCSMNPLENEAVVSSAIERCGGSAKVKLLDCSSTLPELKHSKGLKDWSIMARSGQIYESWPEAQQFEAEGSKVVPGMFPPEDAEQIPLENCMRMYPHQQDTGGFFVAVLEKQTEIKAKPEPECKCSNRDWIYTEPEKAPVTAILKEVQEAKPNPLGGLEMKSLDKLHEGNVPSVHAAENDSAAARQNQQVEDVNANGKRKADDEGASPAKRSRTAAGEDDGDAVMFSDHDAQTGADTPAAVDVPAPVSDATKNAPFESAVPSDLQAPVRRRRGDDNIPEESFKYLSPSHPELESIYSFYELHSVFPRDRFLVRNPAGDPVKGIYYSSTLVRDILTSNEGRGFKFVHAGVKMFMKQDVQGQPGVCRWRIQTEGLPIVEGWVGEGRTVRLWRKSTLRKLLVEMFPRVGGAEGEEGWRKLGEIGERVKDLGMGCCVLRVLGKNEVSRQGLAGGEGASWENDDDAFEEGLTLPLWRSLHSLNLMLPKEERKAMLLRIYNEDVELVNHSDPKQAKPAPAPAAEANGEQSKGSWNATSDAEELQAKIANAPDEADVEEPPAPSATAGASLDEATLAPNTRAATDGAVVDGASTQDVGVNSRPIVGSSAQEADRSLEADDVAQEDALRKHRVEVEEDEMTKVAKAMPEREGETDQANKTV